MSTGLTREDILRNFPNAKEPFIQANLGNKNWHPVGMKQSSLFADAYENLQRSIIKTPIADIQLVVDPLMPEGTIAMVQNEKVEAVLNVNARKGQWVEIGGKPKFYLRSHWEKNYAHYLQFIKERGYIRDWAYETTDFWFLKIKRGVRSYKPDFKVTMNDGSVEFREVKGFLDRKSKTKLKRMKKYYPEIKVRVIDGAWFKKHGPGLAQIVPGWTKKKSLAR